MLGKQQQGQSLCFYTDLRYIYVKSWWLYLLPPLLDTDVALENPMTFICAWTKCEKLVL